MLKIVLFNNYENDLLLERNPSNNLIYLLDFGISISVDINPSCPGETVTFTSTIEPSGATYTYQWYYEDTEGNNYMLVGETGSTYSTINITHLYNYYVMIYSNLYLSGLASNKIQMILTTPLEASVTITKSPAGLVFCSGETITFTATGLNSGSTPSYEWYLKRSMIAPILVGTNSSIYTGNTFLNNDIIYCLMTSDLYCCTINNPATSNNIIIKLINSTIATLEIESNPASVSGVCTICTGYTTDFIGQVTPSNLDETLFNYTWYINNLAQLNSNYYFFSRNNLTSGDTVKCIMTTGSTLSCITISGESNTITMDVRQKSATTVTITSQPPTSHGIVTVCPYSAVTFTASPANSGTYSWYLNTTNVYNSTSNTYVTSSLLDNDEVYCTLTKTGCTMPGNSNTITVNYYSGTTPTVSIASNPSTLGNPPTVSFCTGGTISFTATTTGDMVTNYYWQKYVYSHWVNISDAPNSRYYSTGTTHLITQTGTTLNIRCRTKTSSICGDIQNANSNTIILSLTGTHNPSDITIESSPVPPFCNNVGIISFSATTTESISNYQWQKSTPIIPHSWSNISGSPNSRYYSDDILKISGYTIRVTVTGSTDCLTTPIFSSNDIFVEVQDVLTPEITIYADRNPICSGMTITFTGSTLNAGYSPNFDWYRQRGMFTPVHVGTGYIYTGNTFLDNDDVFCILTSKLDCAGISAVTSNTITVDVNNSDYITVTISASPNTGVCYGTGITLTALANGGSGYLYQWRYWETGYNNELDNPAEAHWVDLIGETGSTYNTIAYYDIIYDVVVTTAAGCIKESNSIGITIYNYVTPEIIIGVDQNPVCVTTTVPLVNYSINYLIYEGNNPTYEWLLYSGSTYYSVGSGETMSYTPTNGDIIYCDLSSSMPCATSSPVRSSGITMIVTGTTTPIVTISPTGYTSCSTGGTISLTATTNNVSVTNYSWLMRDEEVTPPQWTTVPGSSNSRYMSKVVDNSIAYFLIKCQITASGTCISSTIADSNSVYVYITGNNPIGVSISAIPSGSTCSGTTVYFTASPTNPGNTPSYQWKVNNVNVGTNSINYQYIPSSGDTIKCVLTSSAICATGNPATSNTLTMDVITKKTPSVSILASPSGETCSGTTVTITATPVNGGTSPQYKWYKQWILIPGETNSTYQYNPSNNDVLECELISNVECPLYTNSVSQPLVMIVNPNITAGILINSTFGAGTITIPLSSSTIDFYINSSSGSCTTPTYQWYKNDSIISGAIYSTYSGNSWVDGDIIKLSMTGDCACTNGNPAISNTITIDIIPIVYDFRIFTDFNHLNICLTESKYFWSYQSGYTSPTYEWRLNGDKVGGNTYYLNTNDWLPWHWDIGYNYIHCKISESGKPDTTSNTIFIYADQKIPTVTIHTNGFENPICSNMLGYVVFDSVITNGGTTPHYQWKKNNISVGIDDHQWITNGDIANGDVITLEVTSNATCAVNPGISSPYTILIEQAKTPSMYITSNPSGTIPCGTSVYYYVFSSAYGGTNPQYIWYKNENQCATGSGFTTTTLRNGDIIKCVMISNYPCRVPENTYQTLTAYISYPIVTGLTIDTTSYQGNQDITLSVTYQNPPMSSEHLYYWYRYYSPINSELLSSGPDPYYTFYANFGARYKCKLVTENSCYTNILSNVISMDALYPSSNCPKIKVVPTNGGNYDDYKLIVRIIDTDNNQYTECSKLYEGSMTEPPYCKFMRYDDSQHIYFGYFYKRPRYKYLFYIFSDSHPPGRYPYGVQMLNESGGFVTALTENGVTINIDWYTYTSVQYPDYYVYYEGFYIKSSVSTAYQVELCPSPWLHGKLHLASEIPSSWYNHFN